MVTALVVGSFDPFTLGHAQLVETALKLADKVEIVVAQNVTKKYLLSAQERVESIQDLYSNSKVKVSAYSGLISQYCIDNKIDFIVKGVRNSFDFENEKNMAIMNEKMCGVETIFVPTKPHLQHISSTLVREILAFGGEIKNLVPPKLEKTLLEKTKKAESNHE